MSLKVLGNILAAGGLGLVFLAVWIGSILLIYKSVRARSMTGGERIFWVAIAAALPVVGALLYLLGLLFGGLVTPPPEPPARQTTTELQLPPVPAPRPSQPSQQARPAALPIFRLAAVEGPCAGLTFSLERLPARIGRGADAAVRLEDDLTVSRQHAEIYSDGRALYLRDLGSRHGTLVNGAPAGPQRLSPGDTIKVGDTLLRVEGSR